VAEPSLQKLPIEQLRIIDHKEQQRLVHQFNPSSNRDFSKLREKSVAELFREQVAISPDKLAVVAQNSTLTYQQLDQQSDTVAAYLLTQSDMQAEQLIGVVAKRSITTIVAIVGILKAGAAYLPLDADYPEQRLLAMCQAAAVSHILGEQDESLLIDSSIRYTNINQLDYSQHQVLTLANMDASRLAYALFTSGTTGTPKGTLIEQAAVIRLVKQTRYFPFSSDQRLLATGSVSFDASTFEIWGMLLNGGCLHIEPKETLLSAEVLANYIQQHHIQCLQI
jgi:non-ribosomal peptide synthetase component F